MSKSITHPIQSDRRYIRSVVTLETELGAISQSVDREIPTEPMDGGIFKQSLQPDLLQIQRMRHNQVSSPLSIAFAGLFYYWAVALIPFLAHSS